MSDKYFVYVFYDGSITTTQEGDTFVSDKHIGIAVNSSITFTELKSKILRKLKQPHMEIKKMYYRLPMTVGQHAFTFKKFRITNDAEVSLMFDMKNEFPEVRIMEVLVVLQEVCFSSGGSVPEPSFTGFPAHQAPEEDEGSRGFPILEMPRNSPGVDEDVGFNTSFADLRAQLAQPLPLPVSTEYEPTFEVHPSAEADIGTDEDAEELVRIPVGGNGESDEEEDIEETADGQLETSRCQRYGRSSQSHSQRSGERPGHFSTLNLAAMEPTDFAGCGGDVARGPVIGRGGVEHEWQREFVAGQLFRDKDAVIYAVKMYNIRRRYQYRVVESDQEIYHGRCLKFGSGCNWAIRVSYSRTRKVWIVRKYFGPHTCVFPSNSQQHRQLDSSIICQCILPMVQEDPTISIKGLQSEIESRFRNKTTYRKVWIAKQKAIAQIYGDWEQSYNELPRWLQGLQFYVPGKFPFDLTLVCVV